ncbi:MAG: hypothetical protein WC799_04820 [Desulfobacteraceae bacterium]
MTMILDKDFIIERLTLALKQLFLDDLEGFDRIAMESSVDRFIIEKVAVMSADDIVDTFYTPENSVRRFMEFLEDSGALEEADGQTIH